MCTRKIVIFLSIVLIAGCFLSPSAKGATDRRLVIAVGQEPGTMDPNLMQSGADMVVVENWGEFLISKATRGDLKPGLAASWKMSSDGKEIEFTLRKGVKFHSGDVLTTKDVKFSFERGMAKNLNVKGRLKSMERLEVIDDYRFRIRLKAPDVTLIPNRVGGVAIVSKDYYDRVGEDRFVKNPSGTGPYKFVRYAPGESVEIERFEEYWGEKPSVRQARFVFVNEDTTRIAKLKAGEVDLITACPYPSVRDIENSPGFKTIRLATHHPAPAVIFSTRNPKMPWHDRRVRFAMACAVDWAAIVKTVLWDIPNHWASLAPHELGYDPSIKPYPYDPNKARQLLAEAGYPKGFDLKFYWPITGRFPMTRETSEAIGSYFEAIGIRTKLVGEEWNTFYSRRRAAKEPTAEFVGYFDGGLPGAPDPTYYLDLYFCSNGTFSIYSNPELDRVTAEAIMTVNDAKRAELIKKAARIVYDEVPNIPIFNNVAVYAMKGNIDFEPTQQHAFDLVLVKDITVR